MELKAAVAQRASASAARGAQGAVCRRCGQCCLRGGPVLMQQDASLLENGLLDPRWLVSLRKGEWVRDDVRGVLCQQEQERIKLAGAGSGAHPWRCCQYHSEAGLAQCAIYERRPAQCAALFCQAPQALENLLTYENPLSRAEACRALGQGNAKLPVTLWLELAAAHEEQNPVAPALDLAARMGFAPKDSYCDVATASEAGGGAAPDAAARAALMEELTLAVRTDTNFRELCVERAALPKALLPFVLGRPLAALLAEVGLRLC